MALNRAALVAAAAAAACWGVARQGLFDAFHGRGGGAGGVHDGSGKPSSRFGANGAGGGMGRPAALLAEGAPVVMDGRGTAIPFVVDYGVAEPVTVMAWLLVYSPHAPSLVNSTGTGSSLSSSSPLLPPIPPSETALLSFARPRPYRLGGDGTASGNLTIAPAPGLHLSVGADEARGYLFYGGASDDKGRLTGFFSRQPLLLNEWVHVALVLEPPTPAAAKAAARWKKAPQAIVKGYIDGKLQGRLPVDVSVLPAFLPEPSSSSSSSSSTTTTTTTTSNGTDPHAQAVFAWGGVRARGAAMLTGLLQHAAVHVGEAFSDADIHAAMEATRPQPVPDDLAEGLRLRPPSPPATPPTVNASTSTASNSSSLPSPSAPSASPVPVPAAAEEDADARATRWLEEAVALLQAERGEKDDDERGRAVRAHWLLSSAVLLGAPPVAAAAAAANAAAVAAVKQLMDGVPVPTTNGSSSSSSSNSSNSSETTAAAAITATAAATTAGAAANTTKPTRSLRLPPGAAPRIAQLILAAQASHGLDNHHRHRAPSDGPTASSLPEQPVSILDPASLQARGGALLAAGEAVLDDSFRLIGSDADVVVAGDCAVAAAHYLSLAGWAAARFGAEHRVLAAAAAGGGNGSDVVVNTMVVKQPEEVVLPEGPEGRLRLRRGAGGAAAGAAAGADGDGDGDGDGGWSLSLPAFQLQDGNGGGLAGGELEYMRARAEGGGDVDALVWMAQSLYWGRHGLQPDRAAAFRLMERAAEWGHPEAQYNMGIMLLHGEGGVPPDAARAEELVGRAAAQGFSPALATQGLWTLQRGVEAEERQRAQAAADAVAAAAQREGAAVDRRPWPAPPSASRDTYLPGEGGAEGAGTKSAAPPPPPPAPPAQPAQPAGAAGPAGEPAYVKEAEALLRQAVAAWGANPEAHAALATLRGWGRVGLGQLQATDDPAAALAEADRARLWEIAERLAAAASNGHVRARVGLAAGLWDPIVAFDLSSSTAPPSNATSAVGGTPPPARLTVHSSGFGRAPVQLPPAPGALRRSCPLAVGLARPAAEFALSGIMERALAAYDAGDDAAARRLYALAAEAGLVSAQVNAEALLRHKKEPTDGLRRRLLQQMALQGWGPAVRELGRAAEARGGEAGLLEAVALYHRAGARHGDSQALYNLGALLERIHHYQHQSLHATPATARALAALLPAETTPARLALLYYACAVDAAGVASPQRWPPLLAFGLLWARTEGRARLAAAAGRWEDAALLLLGLLLSRVLALMAARAQRQQQQRQEQEQEQEEDQQQRAALAVPSSPARRRPVGEGDGGLQLQPDDVSRSPPPVAASDPFFDAQVGEAGAPSVALREHEEEKAEPEPKRPSGAATAAAAAACAGP